MLVLQGCIKENLAECVYRLTFNFKPAGCTDTDPFPARLNRISVFAFDENKVFTEEFKVSHPAPDATVLLPLPNGRYTLVVWAGFTDEQVAANLVKGVSSINDLHITSYTSAGTGYTPSKESLYYGIIQQAVINDLPPVLSEEVPMMQNSKQLRLRVNGLDPGNYQLVITHNAARYAYNDVKTPSEAGDDSTTEPMTANSLTGAYTAATSLLWPVGQEDAQLTVFNLNSGYPELTISLSELLAKLPGVSFDCEPEINMSVNYRTHAQVDVNLNGWWIIHSNNEL
jgi:hypothetical protein